MRIVSLLLIILLSCPEVLRAENSETQKILEELDAVIAKKGTYQARKEATIEGLKGVWNGLIRLPRPWLCLVPYSMSIFIIKPIRPCTI